ncbi:MAG: Mur ligase family protein, partial [Bacteroidota bacterium]
MNLSSVHSIHFIGIGGIGMSALARYFHAAGKTVTGYDRTATELTNNLAQEGMAIHYVDDPQAAPAQVDLVVYTPAIPKDHRELHHFRQAGTPVAKRSEVLGWVTREARTVAVAGTHGKTTTSSIIAHLLTHSNMGCTAFLGGIVLPYQTNLLLGSPEAPVVVEADEYDRSFLALHPDIAIITSMDADHLDIYGAQGTMVDAFTEFAGQLKPGGQLILHHGLELANPIDRSIITYGLEGTAQISARNIRVENGQFHFEVHFPDGVLDNLAIGLPGRHNIDNAVAAIAVARSLGLSDSAIREALATFEGVKRRFEFRIRKDDLVFIDDYAHHP